MNSDLVRDMSNDSSAPEGNVVSRFFKEQTFDRAADIAFWPVDKVPGYLGCDATVGTSGRNWGRSLLFTAVLVGLVLVFWYLVAVPFLPGWLTGATFRRETRRRGRASRRADRRGRRGRRGRKGRKGRKGLKEEGYTYFNEKCGAGYYPCDDETDGDTIKDLIEEAGNIEMATVHSSAYDGGKTQGGDFDAEDTSNATATPNLTESYYESPVFHEVPDQLRRLENREQEAVRLYNKINAERQRRVNAGTETPTPVMPWEQYWSEYKRDNHVDY